MLSEANFDTLKGLLSPPNPGYHKRGCLPPSSSVKVLNSKGRKLILRKQYHPDAFPMEKFTVTIAKTEGEIETVVLSQDGTPASADRFGHVGICTARTSRQVFSTGLSPGCGEDEGLSSLGSSKCRLHSLGSRSRRGKASSTDCPCPGPCE